LAKWPIEQGLRRGVKIAKALSSPVSTILVNWNTKELLLACLRSLGDCARHQVIVVDNESADGSADAVAEAFPWVELIRAGGNLGYARGNNLGFKAATHPYLLALNPDTEISIEQIERGVEILESNPQIGCLAAKLVDPPPGGKTQRSVRGFPTFMGLLGAWTGLDRRFPHSPLGSYFLPGFNYDLEQLAPQPMGTFLLFRREALESVRETDLEFPFDPLFPIFFNDVDLSQRLETAGWKTLYTPEIVIAHHGGASTRQQKPAMIWESHRSLIRYLAKHRGRATAALLAPLILLGAFVRAKGYSKGFQS